METIWIRSSAHLTSNKFLLINYSTQNKVWAVFDVICVQIPMRTACMKGKICSLARSTSSWHKEPNIADTKTRVTNFITLFLGTAFLFFYLLRRFGLHFG
ncbi:unnamed protein product [Pseudo-nitzschia multistriata]|uniref:Uncharacterized protein n=1 Tax=Pseudo-nitzschia multistriata TaxID=183589 RepID=A0A448ZKP8_9STRA|nr:unnamed protein product [Pseudo-nitzschia multistriata]